MNDLQIRTATKNDQELLFEWINDSEVRKWSFNKKLISYEHHKDWFNRILNDNNILFLIFEQKNTPIAIIIHLAEGSGMLWKVVLESH